MENASFDNFSMPATQGSSDAVLVKLASNGQLLWMRGVGSAQQDAATGLAVDRKGNAYIAGINTKLSGVFNQPGGNRSLRDMPYKAGFLSTLMLPTAYDDIKAFYTNISSSFFQKYDANGNQQASQSFQSLAGLNASYIAISDIAIDENDKPWMVGKYSGPVLLNNILFNGKDNFFVGKLNQDLTFNNLIDLGGNDPEAVIYNMSFGEDGNIGLTGIFNKNAYAMGGRLFQNLSGQYPDRSFAMRLDQSGHAMWAIQAAALYDMTTNAEGETFVSGGMDGHDSYNVAGSRTFKKLYEGTEILLFKIGTEICPSPLLAGAQPATQQNACSGKPYSISVPLKATGTVNFITWYKDGAELSGFNTSTISTPSAVVGHSGVYEMMVSNTCGELLAAQVNLLVNETPGKPKITQTPNSNTVNASTQAVSYLWFLNGELVVGASARSITPIGRGTLKVVAFNGSCHSDTSDAYNYEYDPAKSGATAINSIDKNALSFSPNPASTHLKININLPGTFRYLVYNSAGMQIKAGVVDKENINIEDLNNGVYIVQIIGDQASTTQKLLVQR